jgi:vesicle coat complex subunit
MEAGYSTEDRLTPILLKAQPKVIHNATKYIMYLCMYVCIQNVFIISQNWVGP